MVAVSMPMLIARLAAFVILGGGARVEFYGGRGKRAASFTRMHELVANNECLRDEDLLVGRENHCTNTNFSTN